MARINKQIERDQVLNPCLKLCKALLLQGAILQYRRLDVFDKTHIEGSPDIEIFLPKNGIVWILMAECKKPMGGIFSKKQKEYRDKYKIFNNVIYAGITECKQLKDIIFINSDFGNERMEEFNNLVL